MIENRGISTRIVSGVLQAILILLFSATPARAQTSLLSRDDVVRLALIQASTFQQAQISERIAEEDVVQAKAAFLPKLISPSSFIYTTPAGGNLATVVPRDPSFIAANAVREFEALAGVTGELDITGRLRATLRRNRQLLAAAHAGTEVARKALIQATVESYYGLALAIGRRRSADQALAAALEFERNTSLLVNGGEVPQVDLVRARLQTSGRRDELEQARSGEAAAADGLRVFVGYGFETPLEVTDLALALPVADEVERFTATAINQRPELAMFDAQRRAADEDVALARKERLPQLTYSLSGGFDTDSLSSIGLHEHAGGAGTVSLTVPIFDWGASRSRERQAKLRKASLESSRELALRGFAQQFHTARAQALSAASRIQIATTAVTDAQRNVEVSIARYRAGEAQIIEVTDAQNGLVAQRGALYQAIYDYQVSLVRLRQATGQ
jgi:outer membrane protein, multidrug efflux system